MMNSFEAIGILTCFQKSSGSPGIFLVCRTALPGARNGANNGLKILLDTESFDYTSSFSGAEGFVLSILHHLDIPIMKQSGINVQPGQSMKIAVTPTLTSTSSSARRRFSPEQRHCYFEDEISLRHFPPENDYR